MAELSLIHICGGADGQHAFAGLKIGNGLQTGFIGIAEIMPDSTVEMNIHQMCIRDSCFRHWRRSPLQHPVLSVLLA